MSFIAIQKEGATWPEAEQDRLAAYLSVLRMTRSSEHAEQLSRRLSDREPGRWLTLEEVRWDCRGV